MKFLNKQNKLYLLINKIINADEKDIEEIIKANNIVINNLIEKIWC